MSRGSLQAEADTLVVGSCCHAWEHEHQRDMGGVAAALPPLEGSKQALPLFYW